MKRLVTLGLALVCHFAVAQSEETAKIEVLYGGYFSKSEDKYPGASIFERDESGPVQFRHKGALLDCDIAYLYAEENRLEAYGNIVFNQGDTLILNSKELIYMFASIVGSYYTLSGKIEANETAVKKLKENEQKYT